MFTRIVHPTDGRELQIKTGDDLCETYRVGDHVNWHVDKRFYGYGTLLDGVYDSYSDKGVDDWVVIRNHTVAAVEDKKFSEEELYKKYDIPLEPPKSLWSEEVYQKYCEQQERFAEENEKFIKSISHLLPQEQLAAHFTRAMSRVFDYKSCLRKCFIVEDHD